MSDPLAMVGRPAGTEPGARGVGGAVRYPHGGTVRLVLADDHLLFRDGLRVWLEAERDFLVVGEAPDGAAAIQLTEALQPDVLLLDIAMPGSTGFDTLRTLDSRSISCKVVVLTAAIEPSEIVEALELGARGVVIKTSAASLLIQAIRSVMKGEYWVGRESTTDLVRYLREHRRQRLASGNRFGLTNRELQIVAEVVSGYTNREISKRLGLSPDTVKHHLANAFDKTGVSNRLELAFFGVNHRLVPHES